MSEDIQFYDGNKQHHVEERDVLIKNELNFITQAI